MHRHIFRVSFTGHNQHRGQRMACRPDLFRVKLNQRVSRADLLSLIHKELEAVSVHIHRIDSHMNQKLQSVCQGQAAGMGTQLYYLQRLRYLDDVPLILDHNYFLKELMPGLTPEIAEHSIYEYLEQTLGFTISTSKRTMTVERVTQVDETYLDMNDYNCMAVISSQTFNADGIQFEYTQSRHRPDHFQFQDVAVRKKNS